MTKTMKPILKKKRRRKKADVDLFNAPVNISKEWCEKRVKELLKDDYCRPLLYTVGKIHNMTPTQVEKQKKTKNFKGFVIDYLMG